MTPAQRAEVAAQLECPAELLPIMAELLADFEELGSDAETTLELLTRAGLARGSRILDLACGKGGLSIPLALELDAKVLGVDLMPAFIEASRERAQRSGVEAQCRFEVQDIRHALDRPDHQAAFDAVLYAAVSIFDTPRETLAALRRVVRPGGLILIDDGCVADDSVEAPEHYEDYATLTQTRAQLQSHGDRIVIEHVHPSEEISEDGERELGWLRARGEAACHAHPALAPTIRSWLESQAEAYAFLSNDFISATWILARAAKA